MKNLRTDQKAPQSMSFLNFFIQISKILREGPGMRKKQSKSNTFPKIEMDYDDLMGYIFLFIFQYKCTGFPTKTSTTRPEAACGPLFRLRASCSVCTHFPLPRCQSRRPLRATHGPTRAKQVQV
ncbi:hypothetical protein EGW08_003638 [Elysia chlorotica]|uniref:Uncharacterized protein n=1 Tax=Elysia chlorotica TaxID=188477 RepID=A0A433U463_ELYCH|nr:hypothetical protein EGW08_003638 [Elysia chlorotica]